MTRPNSLLFTLRSAQRTLSALLLALAAAACDGRNPTAPPGEIPVENMRLSALVVRDTFLYQTTRHDFIYDGSGRLQRVEFRISRVPNGPPDWLTHYAEHAYAGNRLVRSDFHALHLRSGAWVHDRAITYQHDAQGRLATETIEFASGTGVAVDVVTHTYDSRGRVAQMAQRSGDVDLFGYAENGSLGTLEQRWQGGNTMFSTFQHDTGRNPFYGNRALFHSLIIPFHVWPMLLSPNNMLRQHNRVNGDPTLISSVTHSFAYDDEGRPLHMTQVLKNDHDPQLPVTSFFYDFHYEPIPGS